MFKKMKRLSVILSLVLVLIFGAMTTYAVDLSASNNLTVNAIESNSVYADDLSSAGIVIDLYQIASAIPVEGSDSYAYSFHAPYSSITVGDIAVSTINMNGVSLSNQQWQNLAEQAARMALDNRQTPTSSSTAGSSFSGLSAGLYLVIAHGSANTGYQEETNDQGENVTVTAAQTDRYTYYFSPTVVSLPTKAAMRDENNNLITDEDGLPIINTGAEGEWLYSESITMKIEIEPQYGGVQITKVIDAFPEARNGEEPEEVTFVFRITAQAPAGNPFPDDPDYYYTNVLAVPFNAYTGLANVAADYGIRAGAVVTVEEIYTGPRYEMGELVYPASTEIVAGVGNEIAFTAYNTLNDESTGGHGIQNYFVRTESENDSSVYWEVDQQTAANQGTN